ncbi:MAG: YeeE/YedE thiosulfate transporter family protein [Ignavibacteriaceae bacterium]
MGPLVPDVIGNELNFIVALFIGIAFGFILEQAGFSTSKKLVGLFYGYDFTVLRVFFTAGVTAMIGIIIFGHYGLLDVNLIYVNPTFLYSALVGGFIMGLGFVIGGYCPGTSFVGAAIGKIDGWIFIGGSVLGVFIFAEGYPLFEGFYKAEFWGYPRLFETLGISQSLYAFLLVFVAVFAFWVTTLIENRVNGKPNPEFRPVKLYVGLTGLALLIALSAFVLPDRKEAYIESVNDVELVKAYTIKEMTSDELAFRLIDNDKRLQIIDVRSPKEFEKFKLPKSVSITKENLFEKDYAKLLTLNGKINVFLAEDELTARKAAVIADRLGYVDVRVLKGGLSEFKSTILHFQKPETVSGRRETDTYRFREKAKQLVPVLIEQNKETGTVQKKSKRVIGGC